MSNQVLVDRINGLLGRVERMRILVDPDSCWVLLGEARDALIQADQSLSQVSELLSEKQDRLDSMSLSRGLSSSGLKFTTSRFSSTPITFRA